MSKYKYRIALFLLLELFILVVGSTLPSFWSFVGVMHLAFLGVLSVYFLVWKIVEEEL
jgi:hypothetical protein